MTRILKSKMVHMRVRRREQHGGSQCGGHESHSRAWVGCKGSLPQVRAAEWAAAHLRWCSRAARPGSQSDVVP